MNLLTISVRRAASLAFAMAVVACGGGSEPEDTTPASIVITPSGTQTLLSGATQQLSADVRTKAGKSLPTAPVTWSSSAATSATVSGSGLVTGLLAGPATITASAGSAIATAQFNVTPGVASRLDIRTQPSATAGAGVALGTQPVIDVKDAAGNIVTSSTVAITASVVEAGGTVGGTATVSAVNGTATFTGLSITGLVGSYTLRFTAAGFAPATSGAIVLGPGVANRLAIRTQPAGAVSGVVFTTQPVVEIRDVAGNIVTSATTAVSAAIATGGGTLSGAATVNAVAGVATFTGLAITGSNGDRTLSFSAAGLTGATSAPFTLTGGGSGGAGLLVATPSSIAFTAAAGGVNPAQQTISLTNGGAQAIGTLGGTISYTSASTGWLSGSFSSATVPSTVTLTASVGALPAGTHTANVILTSAGASNSPLTIPITFTLTAPYTVTYGTGNRLVVLDVNGTTTPTVVVRDPAGNVVTTPAMSFVSRAPAVATVSSAGQIRGVANGQAWLVASADVPGVARDSVLAVVTRDATGPVLRVDVPNAVMNPNDLITVPVVLDMRSAGKLSAATVTVTWPADFFTGFLAYVSHTIGASNLSPVVSVNSAQGITRVTVANVAGVDGQVELMRITFRANATNRSGFIVATANEVILSDLTVVTDKTTPISFPVRVR